MEATRRTSLLHRLGLEATPDHPVAVQQPLVLSTALAVDGDTTWAAVATDDGLRLWRSQHGGRWEPTSAPVVSGPERVLLGAACGRLVLAVQRGQQAWLWVAPG